MNMHLFKRPAAAAAPSRAPKFGHQVDSTFDYSSCHFVLTCTCGTTYETNHIDEALEWSEEHREMYSLRDRVSA